MSGRRRVGLLGGSFNPAHAGHRLVARTALARLHLDQVWLLVSPGNPLKPRRGMAPLAARLASAGTIADGRRIVATDVERTLGTRFTVDTLEALLRRHAGVRFVWLMGADVLAELPRWRRWRHLVRLVAFAVLPRPGYTRAALSGQAARLLRPARVPSRRAGLLWRMTPPAWTVLPVRENNASATDLRRRGRVALAKGPGP